MKYALRICVITLVALLSSGGFIQASESQPGIYVIYDSSNSMWAEMDDGKRRYEAARGALENFLRQGFEGRDIALRVYGHRRADDCSDTELVLPFGPSTGRADEITRLVSGLRPKGRTPIDLSFRQALVDFGDRSGDIVLISDGIESCNADPCALMEEWRDKNVAIRVHVVGFGVSEKEKAGLQCIAEAAGTDFLEANNADELNAGLAEIRLQSTDTVFKLAAHDSDGNQMRARGVLAGATDYEVSTYSRHIVEPGSYTLSAGMALLTGEIYLPVTMQVDIFERQETTSDIMVIVPPRVTPKYGGDPIQLGDSSVRVIQGETELASFRVIDAVYLAPGTYDFALKPAAGEEIIQTVTLQEGDDVSVTFSPPLVVSVLLKFIPEGRGEPIRANSELWKNDEKVAFVHASNGAHVRPDKYVAHLQTNWIDYSVEVEVSDEPANQTIEIPVPVGFVTILYQDAEGNQVADKRFALGRGESVKGRMRQSGESQPVSPGTYNVEGWGGDYDSVIFDIAEGEEKTIVLREKAE